MKLRRPHTRTGQRTRPGRCRRSRRSLEAERDGFVAGLGWYVRREAKRSRRRRHCGLRRSGGLWLYRKHTWDTKLRVIRLFQRRSDSELAEWLGKCQRNLARFREEAHLDMALGELDGSSRTGRGGMPRSLLDPAAGGRGGLPDGWEPLDW